MKHKTRIVLVSSIFILSIIIFEDKSDLLNEITKSVLDLVFYTITAIVILFMILID
jgi:hypothetical protein